MIDMSQGLKHNNQIKDMKRGCVESLRAIARVMKHPAHRQRVIDLIDRLGPTKDPEYSMLPSTPTGFVLKYRALEANGSAHLRTQCEFQVITMMISYFWLFSQTGDMQDMRSFMRYKGWIGHYAEAPGLYEVCGTERTGYWLCNTSVLKEGEDPTLPRWLKDDGGETV